MNPIYPILMLIVFVLLLMGARYVASLNSKVKKSGEKKDKAEELQALAKKLVRNKLLVALAISIVPFLAIFYLFPDLYDWLKLYYLPWGILISIIVVGSFVWAVNWFNQKKLFGGYLIRLAGIFICWMFVFWIASNIVSWTERPRNAIAGLINSTPEIPKYVPDSYPGRARAKSIGNNIYVVDIPLEHEWVRLEMDLLQGETVKVKKIETHGVVLPPVVLAGDKRATRFAVGPFGACEVTGSDTTYVTISRLEDQIKWEKYRAADGLLYVNPHYFFGSPMFIINGYPHMRPLNIPFVLADSAQELSACVNLKRKAGNVYAKGFFRVTFEKVLVPQT